jgi:hypothetical protein
MKFLRVVFFVLLIPISSYAHPGIGLVYDGDQTIYYTDLVHIWKLNTITGEASIFLENLHSHELWLDEDGSLYGEHYWYDQSNEVFKHYIWMATPDGQLNKISETIEGENDHFSFVRESISESYLTRPIDSYHELIRTDSNSIVVFPDFTLQNPEWMYQSSDSSVYILDRDFERDVVQLNKVNFRSSTLDVLSQNLKIGKFPFSMLDHHSSVYGIWEDDQSNIYVALYGGRQVVQIDQDLNQETVFKSSFFWSPVNGVFDSNNNLWVMEASIRGKVRVRKVTLT